MKQLKDWHCNFTIDSETPLTVGQKFAILCKGTTPIDESLVPTLDVKDEDHIYDLVFIGHKFKTPYELFIPAASWKVGQYDYGPLKLKLGENYIDLNGPNVKVTTTIMEQNQTMNPPPGPKFMIPPEATWYVLGAVLFGLIVWALKAYRQSVKIDRGLLKLSSFKTSLTPFYEFQKQVRVAKKSLEKTVPKNELHQITVSLYKGVVIFMSFMVNKPLFVLTEDEVHQALKKKISDPAIIKEYFYLLKEIKSQSADFKKETSVESTQLDLEGLVEETNDFSQRVNKYFIGVNRV